MTATAQGGLQARIARLEQLVSQLQAQAGGGEQLSPNYLTLGPDGTVGASFTGFVNALGLIIPAGVNLNPPLVDRLSFVNAAGITTSYLAGFDELPGNDVIGAILNSQANDAAGESTNVIRSQPDASDPSAAQHTASLQVLQQSRGAAGPVGSVGGGTEVDAFVGFKGTMILDVLGRSNMPQTDVPYLWTAGQNTLQFPGGSDTSLGLTIPLAGAVSRCFCLALPFAINSSKFPTLAYQSLANGVTLFAQTPGIVQPVCSVSIYYFVFGN